MVDPSTAPLGRSEHPDEEVLLALVEGRADEALRRAIHDHADECSACFQLLADLARQEDGSEVMSSEAPGVSRLMRQAMLLTPGDDLDRFVLLEMLGRGAMGTVYAAYDRQLDRKVALKVLHDQQWLDSDGRTQLLREARALGKISHPHVVPVHEVGEVDDRLYVVMEHIQGQTLRAWIDQRSRPWAEVVDAFVQAGEGLAAAHAADVVHRDFKPDNVLVGDDGRVRVVDFGLARAPRPPPNVRGESSSERDAASPRASHAWQSLEGTLCGTPAYMAPEQWRGAAIDGRTDQFAWCVALYEALCGARPFVGDTPQELVESLRTSRMRPPPSSLGLPVGVLRVLERGLAIEPERRWPSMEALLAELRRAVAPRRNRWLAWGGIAGLLTVGVGLAYRAEVARQAEAARQVEHSQRCRGARARLDGIWDEARRTQLRRAISGIMLPYAAGTWARVETKLDDYAAAWVAKHTEVCEATSIRQEQSTQVMDLRMGCLHDRRRAMAEAVEVLAHANPTRVENAVDLVSSLPGLARCDDIEALRAQHPPPDDPEVAARVAAQREQLARAYALQVAGEYEPGLAVATAVVETAGTLPYQPLRAEALLHRGNLQSRLGEYDQAQRDLEQAHLSALEHGPAEVAARAAGNLAFLLSSDQAQPERGQWWGRIALASSRALPHAPLAEADALAGLGSAARSRGDLDESLRLQQQVLEIETRAPGDHERRVSTSLVNIGVLYREKGDLPRALEHLQRALELDTDALGAEHPLNATTRFTIAMVLHEQGHLQRALAEHQRVLELREQSLGPEHPEVAGSLNSMGTLLLHQGRLDEALASYERALAQWERTLGPEHPAVAAVLTNTGVVLREQGELSLAQERIERGLAIREAALGPNHPDVAFSVANLGMVRWAQGDVEQALAHHRRALRLWEDAHGRDYPGLASPLVGIGNALRAQGKLDAARLHFERALSLRERALGPSHPKLGPPLRGLAELAIARGEHEVAHRHAQRAVELLEASPADPAELADARFVLARSLGSDAAQRSTARALAELAAQTYAARGTGKADALARVRGWLADHPGSG